MKGPCAAAVEYDEDSGWVVPPSEGGAALFVSDDEDEEIDVSVQASHVMVVVWCGVVWCGRTSALHHSQIWLEYSDEANPINAGNHTVDLC